jgi:hypothetical protein
MQFDSCDTPHCIPASAKPRMLQYLSARLVCGEGVCRVRSRGTRMTAVIYGMSRSHQRKVSAEYLPRLPNDKSPIIIVGYESHGFTRVTQPIDENTGKGL